MPVQTNTQLIGELREAAAILKERINRIDSILSDLQDQRDRLVRLEVKLEQLEKNRTEERGKAWAVILAIISALIGSMLTILTQLVLTRYLPIK